MPILTLKNFRKDYFGVRAVDNVSFPIEKQQITGLIGPNGSGKSTLINLVTAIVPKDKGVLIISDSAAIKTFTPSDMFFFRITRTFQNVRVFEQMTVYDNVMVALTNRNVWGALFDRILKNNSYHKVLGDRVNDILEQVDILEKKSELAVNLSYGQRKLLEIARVIAMDAEVIFFDEPYAGLFPEMVKKVSNILRQLKSEGKAIVLVEHNLDIIRELCDFLVVMEAGKILAIGSPKEVLKQKSVIDAYIG